MLIKHKFNKASTRIPVPYYGFNYDGTYFKFEEIVPDPHQHDEATSESWGRKKVIRANKEYA